jgi:F-type H+-transporting ATPase subunit gamma
MASLKDIRARIESTKNTQQITKAMKLVSAAKLRKAQNNVVNMRPFALTLRKVIADIAITKKIAHPLMETKSETKKVLLVAMSSDRGLCGAFNSNVIRFTENYLKTNKDNYSVIDLFVIGRKAGDYFSKRGVQPVTALTRLDKDISYKMASEVADKIMQGFLDGHYDEVKIVYNEFKSAISQVACCETILPIDIAYSSFDQSEEGVGFAKDMIYEPAPEAIIDHVITKHFEMQVYRCMSESVASEHGARMTAMENSSNNARDMIASLTLTYNKLRQEKITTELTEIVSGAEALK